MSQSTFERLSLQGRTVLVTRTGSGNAVERKKLEALGAIVVELPLIEIAPPSDQSPVIEAIGEISSFDWIVFTSANGVIAFFRSLNENCRKALRAHFACVGSETERSLRKEGYEASIVPREFLTRQLGTELAKSYDLVGKKVMLARAEVADRKITEILRDAGADVVEVPVYRTKVRRLESGEREISLNGITDITLTSPSTAEALVSNFGVAELTSRKTRIHCIGPVTKERAVELGLRVDTIAAVHTIDGLVDSLVQDNFLEANPKNSDGKEVR